MAAAFWSHVGLTAHCQEPPPIFGPLPKSGGGRTIPSAPSLDRLAEFQMPDQTMADLPLTKSAKASLPDFAGAYPFLTRPWNQFAHFSAAGPLSTPSAVR